MKFVFVLLFTLTTAAFAADDAKVIQGQQAVEAARAEIDRFFQSLPRPLRGYADAIGRADQQLQTAQTLLQESLQNNISGYFCVVTAANGWRYEGRAATELEALNIALKECGIFCNRDYSKACTAERK